MNESPVKEHIAVGMGATIRWWSDSSPATIIQITRNGKRIVLQEDTAVRTDKNGMSECQEYNYSENPEGEIFVATLRKDGHYRVSHTNQTVFIGKRRKYHDFSF